MRKLKWGILALGLLLLTACGKKEPIFSSKQAVSGQITEKPQPQSEFVITMDGNEIACGGVWFGETAFVHPQLMDMLGMTESEALRISVGGITYLSLEELCLEADCALISDVEENHVYLTTKAGQWEIPEGYSVPTLMYHGVSDDMWGMTELFVKPAEMEKQIKYLVENGYTPIWFEDLVNVDKIEKPVILTYDDGYVDNYVDLFPILQKYKVKVTIFLVTGTIDNNPNSLTSEQIREMAQSGLVSFQSHTVSHPYLRGQSREMQEYELKQSAQDVAAITGKMPAVICYPSGSFDETTLELARKYYRMGINMNGNEYITGEDPYKVDRYYIRRQDGLGTFIQYIQ